MRSGVFAGNTTLFCGRSARLTPKSWIAFTQPENINVSLIVLNMITPQGAIRLAIKNNVAVGCGMYHALAPDTAEIKRVYITEPARGTGAGFAVMNSLIEQARQSGYRRILMDTSKPLRAAQKLYLSMGFVLREPYQDVPEIAQDHLLFFEMQL